MFGLAPTLRRDSRVSSAIYPATTLERVHGRLWKLRFCLDRTHRLSRRRTRPRLRTRSPSKAATTPPLDRVSVRASPMTRAPTMNTRNLEHIEAIEVARDERARCCTNENVTKCHKKWKKHPEPTSVHGRICALCRPHTTARERSRSRTNARSLVSNTTNLARAPETHTQSFRALTRPLNAT